MVFLRVVDSPPISRKPALETVSHFVGPSGRAKILILNRAAASAVPNKAVDLALGVAADGTKDILGFWIETTEGAKFWLKVMNELKACGVEDILIAVVDGLKGFLEAIEAVFPQAAVETCIVQAAQAGPSS